MDAQFTVEFDTAATPEQVVGALTDFTDNRPNIWKGLTRSDYQVHSLGPTSADVTEGTVKFWARESYDWSRPGRVTWTCRDSKFLHPGTTMQVIAAPSGSGSHVTFDFHRNFRGFRGALLYPGVKLGGRGYFKKYFKSTFDRVATSS